MELKAIITIIIIVGTFLTMLFTKVKAEIAFFTAMALFCITGVLNFEDSFEGLDTSSVLTIAVLYIVIAGLKHAGALEWIVSHIMGQPKTHLKALLRMMIPVGLLSSVMSNTACTALFQDVVKLWSEKLKIAPSKLLIPLAYSASLGGLLTLIGTPPNLIISSLLTQNTKISMNILAPLPIAIVIFVACIIVVLLFRNFLPDREPAPDNSEALSELKRNANPRKVFISLSIMVLMLVLSATNVLPLTTCCLGAGILMVITRCCTSEQAFEEVDWRVIIVFAGSVCFGKAIQATGIDKLITQSILSEDGNNPYVILFILCASASVLTEFLSDTACAAIFFPVGLSLAQSLGVSPVPFSIALMMSVSSSYATPIATPPNLLVYRVGGYHFGDYARLGLIMKIVSLIIAVALTPYVYPF